MSYLRFDDQADGIHVFFDDVTDAGPLRHRRRLQRDGHRDLDPRRRSPRSFLDQLRRGAGQRRGQDLSRRHSQDHRHDLGGLLPLRPRGRRVAAMLSLPTTTMLFRAGGSSVPANAGNGWLIDNVSMSDAAQCTSTCYVDAVNGSDAFGGASAGDAKKTIQAGIDTVSAERHGSRATGALPGGGHRPVSVRRWAARTTSACSSLRPSRA